MDIDPEDDPRDLSKRATQKETIEVLVVPNNCFVKEHCVFGHNFSADFDYIYLLEGFGYICYDCFEQLKKVKTCETHKESSQ